MQIVHYLLLIYFINLCNSFTLINKKYSPNFISLDYRNKLNMGCDYYIDKDLDLYDNNNMRFLYINLEHRKGYYWFISELDEDEDGYDEEFKKYTEEILEISMKPIVIYSDNSFNKLSFEDKYKQIIQDELKLFNKSLDDVSKIIKTENRYERM